MYSLIYKLIKFGLTGLLGMGIDFGTTWIVKEQFKWNKYIANCCGFLLAVVCNYWINRHWTFESINQLWMTEFTKFLMISLIGLALNSSFIYLFHKKKEMNFYFAKFLAILLVFIWNFSANAYFTFK
jgi:putative flippase GtrA